VSCPASVQSDRSHSSAKSDFRSGSESSEGSQWPIPIPSISTRGDGGALSTPHGAPSFIFLSTSLATGTANTDEDLSDVDYSVDSCSTFGSFVSTTASEMDESAEFWSDVPGLDAVANSRDLASTLVPSIDLLDESCFVWPVDLQFDLATSYDECMEILQQRC